jgi:hypothetical protein
MLGILIFIVLLVFSISFLFIVDELFFSLLYTMIIDLFN